MYLSVLASDFLHFNSIKVRLKLDIEILVRPIPIFQFHKGTIKTPREQWPGRKVGDFNSIKVRLKPSMRVTSRDGCSYFNSIKVRLKLLVTTNKRCKFLFQFHKGTIKTASDFSIKSQLASFQFHKGTIKTLIYTTTREKFAISIP